MIDLPLIRELATLGLGALIAGIVLVWKRADDARYSKALEDMNKTLLTALTANTTALLGVQSSITAQAARSQQEQEIRELWERVLQQRQTKGDA